MRTIAAGIAVAAACIALGALAADDKKTAKQAEIKKATQASMEKFYKANPKLKDEVAKAPGYAVFTTYGISFLVGGAGGNGIAHDAATKKDTYMSMAMATAGIGAGISQRDTLIVFKTPAAYKGFVDKGWEFGGQGSLSAGAGGKTAGGGTGENMVNQANTYSLTPNGLEVGPMLEGTKFWKDKNLN